MSEPFEELRAGNLGVRVARTGDEVQAAQALRFRVFFGEMGATPDAAVRESGLDADIFDAVADHLLVLDHDRGEGPEAVVGTYRLIRRQAAARLGRFYSDDEYDLRPVLDFPGEILELGRSCTDAAYRTRGTLQLLWNGIAAYVFRHEIGLMFGCASLPGTDVAANAAALSYLAQHHLAPEAIRPRALPDRYEAMDRLPAGSYDAKRAMLDLPPLIKGYLRLGAYICEDAVIDWQFGTTDVFIVLPVERINTRYINYYGADATRHAA